MSTDPTKPPRSAQGGTMPIEPMVGQCSRCYRSLAACQCKPVPSIAETLHNLELGDIANFAVDELAQRIERALEDALAEVWVEHDPHGDPFVNTSDAREAFARSFAQEAE